VELVVISALAGDYNNDGAVDAADYVVWRKGIATYNTPAHYAAWATNFGASASGAGNKTPTVPEPATILVLLVGLAALVTSLPHVACHALAAAA
jgi:hypothetical protein